MLLALAFMAGCDKAETDRYIPAIDIDSLELPAMSGRVRVRISPCCDWNTRIVYDKVAGSGWMSVTPSAGKAEETEIAITLSRNNSGEARSAAVVIEYPDSKDTLVITQTGE